MGYPQNQPTIIKAIDVAIHPMATEVTITLPDDVYRRAERFARLANRDLNSVIADTVGASLASINPHIDQLPTIDSLNDVEILALSRLEMEPNQDARLSELLEKQRERSLLSGEPQELEGLMQLYREALLRKTAALVEAVKRGLREAP
jgi:hypothetical protein